MISDQDCQTEMAYCSCHGREEEGEKPLFVPGHRPLMLDMPDTQVANNKAVTWCHARAVSSLWRVQVLELARCNLVATNQLPRSQFITRGHFSGPAPRRHSMQASKYLTEETCGFGISRHIGGGWRLRRLGHYSIYSPRHEDGMALILFEPNQQLTTTVSKDMSKVQNRLYRPHGPMGSRLHTIDTGVRRARYLEKLAIVVVLHHSEKSPSHR